MTAIAAPAGSPPRRAALAGEALAARGGLALVAAALFVFLAAPLIAIFARALQDKAGAWIGFANFVQYFSSPAFGRSAGNTLAFALYTTVLTVPLAFVFAYAIQRSCIRGKWLWRNVALIPILAPSMLAALSFIYLFGNQGVFKALLPWVGLTTIYGMPGMVLAMTFSAFPHAVMILLASLALSDARLYEAADSMATSEWRKFTTITLPGARYGLVSASMVVFTMAVSEFGVPKVIGGNTSVLAVDIYKQVIGQQNFNKGAVVSLVLLVPVLLAFIVDWFMRRRLQAQFSSRAVPYVPRRSPGFDRAMLAFCSAVSVFMLAVLGMAIYTSFIKLWPYDLSFSLRHYVYGLIDAGVIVDYFNSLKMAFYTALFGTLFIFAMAYLLEKTRGMATLKAAVRLVATIPMAVPGLVLGLGYIFFFNHPDNPLNGIYGTMAILVLSTVVHYYTSSHMTAVTALKALDDEFESVSASLKVPFYRTFFRVTLPVSLPAVLDIGRYLFVNGMVTISAVVFLYAPDTRPASVAILNMDEAGEIGAAAGMATLIVASSTAVCVLYAIVTRYLLRRTQAWRAAARP